MNNEPDIPLGDPTARPFFSGTANDFNRAQEKKETTPETAEQSLRPGDSGLGTPDPLPLSENIRILSAAEQSLISDADSEVLEERFQKKFAELTASQFKIPHAFYRGAKLILLLVAGIAGLFALSHGITIYKEIVTLPILWQYIIGGAGIIFTLLIAGVIGRLILLFFALRRSPQINIKALRILEERSELRELANSRSEQARSELKLYLDEYPLADYPALSNAGITSEALTELTKARDDLLSAAHPVSSQEWLQTFTLRFQQILDTAARERIKRYAGKVALGTAASPVGLIDQVIVLYGSLAMIRDILTIYNLRPAFGQSALMLSRAIIQAYLSGMLGDVAENGIESLSDSYQEWSGELLAGSLTSSLKTIFSKTAEAGLNGFLLWRLGKATIANVQMISTTRKTKQKK